MTSLCFAGFEGVTGDQAPLGFWDPLGFSKDLDVEVFKRQHGCSELLLPHVVHEGWLCKPDLSESGQCRRREVEIKHGRVAMFATMG